MVTHARRRHRLAGRAPPARRAGRARLLTRSDFRVPQLATVDLSGRTVHEVVSRGKHLLTRIDDDLTLHTHFRMDGAWHLYRPGDRWRGGPDWQVRLLLETDRVAGGRLPAAGGRAAPAGPTRSAPSATSVRTCSAPTGTLDEAVRRLRGAAGPGDRRGAARPAQPGRHRQPLQGRAAASWPASRPGRRSATSTCRPSSTGPAAAGAQPGPPVADDHRGQPAGPGALGLRAAGSAVPAVRQAGAVGEPGRAALRPGHLLVPALPARAGARAGSAGSCEPAGGARRYRP